MKEIDGKTFMKQKLGLVMGLNSLENAFSKRRMDEVMQMKELSGRLESDGYRYFIRTSEKEKIPISERDMFLKDPSWKYATNTEEDKRLNKKIMERYSGEIIMYGQIVENGIIPYMIHVKKDDNSRNDRFYYSGMIDMPSAIIENKFDIRLPIPNEYRKHYS